MKILSIAFWAMVWWMALAVVIMLFIKCTPTYKIAKQCLPPEKEQVIKYCEQWLHADSAWIAREDSDNYYIKLKDNKE